MLDGVQKLLHIIPQHAQSTQASVQSEVAVAMQRAKQQGNWAAATRFRWSRKILNKRMKLSRCDMSHCFSHITGFIWMYFWATTGADRTKDVPCTLKSLHLYEDTSSEKESYTCKCTLRFFLSMKIWKWCHDNHQPFRHKTRWVTMLSFLFLFPQITVIYVTFTSPSFFGAELLRLSSHSKWLLLYLCTLFSLSGMCVSSGVQEESAYIIHHSGELLSSPTVRLYSQGPYKYVPAENCHLENTGDHFKLLHCGVFACWKCETKFHATTSVKSRKSFRDV